MSLRRALALAVLLAPTCIGTAPRAAPVPPPSVLTFDGRAGAVTLLSSDVTTALGFTPGTGSGSVTSVTCGTGLTGGTITTTGTCANAGVLSFDSRIGAITLLSADVSAALGFTPVQSVAGRTGVVVLGAGDISGLAASATTDTTNAGNISSGTLDPARLPLATSSAVGGVTASTGLSASGGALSVLYGTAANTAAQGNDSRITGALSAASAASTYAPINSPAFTGTPTGDASSLTALATGSTTARTLGAWAADTINVKFGWGGSPGAKGDAITCSDGVIAAGGTAFSSNCATFTAADVGTKSIQIDGAVTINGAPLVTTIAGFTDLHHVTLTTAATVVTPGYYMTLPAVSAGGTSGSYVQNDLLSITGGTFTTQAVAKVLTTKLRSATVAGAGSGGTNGACVLTGTTGTGVLFQINATITSGAISALGSIVQAGHYLTGPTTIATEPVTSNCNLAGSPTLSVLMDPDVASVSTAGAYSVTPANPAATGAGSISGALGATFTVTWQATGTFVYGTDDTAAFAAAFTQVGTLFAAGKSACVDVPAGNYLINGSTLPTFYHVPGCIRGAGSDKTKLIVGASYSGDLFSWSEDWLASMNPFNGATSAVSGLTAGPTVTGLSIVGDRLSAAQQNALMFYDRVDFVRIVDVDVRYLNGRCMASGLTKNTSQAFMRESHHLDGIRCFNDGAAGIPVVEFNSAGSGDATNEIDLGKLDIYAPYGPGLVFRSAGPTIRGIRADKIRIEGLEYDAANVTSDLLVIGDASLTGIVNNIDINQLELADPYIGQYAITINAASSASMPYQLAIGGVSGSSQSAIGGGLPLGGGINVAAGRLLNFNLVGIYTWGTNVTVASSAKVSSGIALNVNGGEDSLSTSINSTSLGFILYPAFRAQTMSLNALGNGTVSLGSVTGGPAVQTRNGAALNTSPWIFQGGKVGLYQAILTGLNPRFQSQDTANFGFFTNAGTSGGQGGTPQFSIDHTASAVNVPGVTGGASGNPAKYTVEQTNASAQITGNGTGSAQVGSSTSPAVTLGAVHDNATAFIASGSVTGTITMATNTDGLMLENSGAVAALTVKMPAVSGIIGQTAWVSSVGGITTLTMQTSAGGTITGAPTSIAAGGVRRMISDGTTWWPVQ